MSPKKSPFTIGLTALGLFAYTATHAAYAGDALPPSGPAPAPASSVTHSVLLKTNGDILLGPVTLEEGRYVVRMAGGPIPIPKTQVEKTFASVPEVYRYKLAQVDERDPDERFKLARWCLTQNMPSEALVELRAVVALSPNAPQVKAMLAKLEASEARAKKPRFDPALVQTGAEAVMPSSESRPAEIDPKALRRTMRDLGVPQGPVIFDLPPALAVKRADQFARNVHPVLQASCVKCHNEQSSSTFQLIEVKSRKGLSGDVLRANLDATLRLIDQDNLARSELLSSGLVPHGNRPNARPIFRGSNDPRYQIIAAWVNSLHKNRPADDVVQTRLAPKEANAGEGQGFAVDRVPGQGAVPGVTTVPIANQSLAPRVDNKVLPPSRAVPGQGMVAEQSAPAPGEFPVPFIVGGPRPDLSAGQAPATPAKPTATVATPANSLPELPDTLPPPSDETPSETPATKTAKPKKPVKLDPELLQKALMNRNIGR